MNTSPELLSQHAQSPIAAERNRVLRNTYWLLALSMAPTVLGAWLGVATGITAPLTGFVGVVSIEDRDPFSPEHKKIRVVTSIDYLLE